MSIVLVPNYGIIKTVKGKQPQEGTKMIDDETLELYEIGALALDESMNR
jgi:hypothetical protein